MPNLNKVFLMGNLTRDPELRYTPNGAPVVSFGLAVNRVYTTQAGERREEACFVTVVVWGKQAESCNQYLNKGKPVFVEGRLHYRQWDTPDGQKRSALEVVAQRVQFLAGIRGVEGEHPTAEQEEAPEEVEKKEEEIPF